MKPRNIGTHQQWLDARLKLLEIEKDLTRRSDEAARLRRELPWVKMEKPYEFDTDEGRQQLSGLFRGRSQLLVYHFMFGPDWSAGCPSCSSIADGFNGIAVHLANHDVMLWAISRAPLEKLNAYKKRLGWTFSWASSGSSDFSYDFNAAMTIEQQQTGDAKYNFRTVQPLTKPDDLPEPLHRIAESAGTDALGYVRDRPGLSAFALDQTTGDVYHTYSAYTRGLDVLWNTQQWLDRAPLGRNETSMWWRRRDEYDTQEPRCDTCCQPR